MTVIIKLFGTLRRFSNTEEGGSWRGDIPDGSSIRYVLERIGATQNEVAIATVDGGKVSLEYIIHEDDEVILASHIGGG